MENTTTTATEKNIILGESLIYDESLLTENEKKLIKPNWADEAVLEVPKDLKELTVDVHSGDFHADDVFSVLLLEDLVSPIPVRVIRTRDPEKLEKADLRLDVGEGLLDHHGRRMVKDRPIAACTRVGQLVCQSFEAPLIGPRKEVIEKGMDLVQEVAAADCGLVDKPCWITKVVQAFNQEAALEMSEEAYDKGFFEALATVRRLLTAFGRRNIAEVEASPTADKIIAEAQPCAKWISFSKEARFAQLKEKLYQAKSKAWYFVSPQAERDWRILCAADPEKEFSGFSSWHLIPEKFRGLRDKELDRALGLAEGSSIFCHQGGFIAGFTSREAAESAATVFVCTVQEELTAASAQ